MIEPDLLSYESVKVWLAAVKARGTRSEKTQKIYLERFAPYVKWTGQTPDQLLDERLAHVNKSRPFASGAACRTDHSKLLNLNKTGLSLFFMYAN